jgi:membrane protein implicated in regulation of membrane protease activity
MEEYMIWIGVIILALIIETITMGLTTVWFAFAALITLIISLLGIDIWAQVGVFVTSSALMLIFLYPIAKENLKLGHEKTNYESIIGRQGKVIELIDNVNATGLVKVEGQIWSAKSITGTNIKEGSLILVKEVKGVKLIVENTK